MHFSAAGNIIRAETGPDIEVRQGRERSLFHIVVQREEYFDRVMQILSADVQGEIAVIEAHNAGYYLHRMPLFSAYWGEDSGRFTRIIVAVADRGVCNDIIRRMHEHKTGKVKGFSKRYNLKKLVYLEEFSEVWEAIAREKQVKNWHRDWKLNLIKQENPEMKDLSASWLSA